jgi:hypothetical protein
VRPVVCSRTAHVPMQPHNIPPHTFVYSTSHTRANPTNSPSTHPSAHQNGRAVLCTSHTHTHTPTRSPHTQRELVMFSKLALVCAAAMHVVAHDGHEHRERRFNEDGGGGRCVQDDSPSDAEKAFVSVTIHARVDTPKLTHVTHSNKTACLGSFTCVITPMLPSFPFTLHTLTLNSH